MRKRSLSKRKQPSVVFQEKLAQWRQTIFRALLGTLYAIWRFLALLRFLNPWLVLRRMRKQSVFVLDTEGSVFCRQSLWERITDVIHSDASSKKRILEWADDKLPGRRVTNMAVAWADGIALCALLEALCPGACPRYDLLKHYNKVNNCRLGLKLANKHLGIPLCIVSAEEIAANSVETEAKMVRLLSLIKWAHAQKLREDDTDDVQTMDPSTAVIQGCSDRRRTSIKGRSRCSAKGSGLMVGLIGRRCKFDIFTPLDDILNLQIEIHSPNGDVCSERIQKLFPFRRVSCVSGVSSGSAPDDLRGVNLWKTGTAKLVGPAMRPSFDITGSHRQSNQNADDESKMSFEYQCVGEGHFFVAYVPRAEGLHEVVIRWHDEQIKGSPFIVNVADSIEKLNQEGLCKVTKTDISYRSRCSVPPSDLNLPPIPIRPGVEVTEMTPELETPDNERPEIPFGVTAAVLNRTSKVQRSISRSGAVTTTDKLPKQATITRRRVLKRIITKGGQEIVIEEAPPTPQNLSREASQDSDRSSCLSVWDDDGTHNRTRPHRPKSNKHHKTRNSFDGEYYDSDASVSSRPTTPPSPSPSKKHFKKHVQEILQNIVDDVFRSIDEKDRSTLRVHKPLTLAKSNPLPSCNTEQLGIPTFDRRMESSPFSMTEEVQSLTVPKHKALCAVRSFPLSLNLKAKKQDTIDSTMSLSSSKHQSLDSLDVEFQMPSKNDSEMANDSAQIAKDHPKQTNHNNIFRASTNSSSSLELPKARRVLTKMPSDPDEVSKRPRSSSTQRRGEALPSTPSLDEKQTEFIKHWLATSMAHNSVDTNRSYDSTDRKSRMMSFSSLDDPFTKQVSVDASDRNESILDEVASTHDMSYQNDRPMLSTFADQPKLRMSYSLPTLSKNWTAFELDEDDSLTIDEMEALSMAAQQKKKRATLGETTLRDSLSEFNPMEDSESIFAPFGNKSHSLDCHLLLPQLESPSSDALSIGPHSPPCPSPALSPLSSPIHSTVNSRRGSHNLVRQDIALERLSEEKSSSQEKMSSLDTNTDSNLGELLPQSGSWALHKTVYAGSELRVKLPSNNFNGKECNTLKPPEHSPDPVNNVHAINIIRVPKPKMDRWTQVKYEEIKVETGWRRPMIYVRPRRRVVKQEVEDECVNDHNLDVMGELPGSHRVLQEPPSIALLGDSLESSRSSGRHLGSVSSASTSQRGSTDGGDSGASRTLLSPNPHPGRGSLLRPVRQSTAETIDSGIVVENQHRPKTYTDLSLPKLCTNSLVPAILAAVARSPTSPIRSLVHPRFINGHRAVSRSRYRGKISLDPQLVSNSPTTVNTSTEDDTREVLGKRRLGLNCMKYYRSNSFTRRSKWRPHNSREESVSENDATKGRRPHTHRPGCCKRRVTFSKRVMMYRRSSSRSSRNSSRQSREESMNTPDITFVVKTPFEHTPVGSKPCDSKSSDQKKKPNKVKRRVIDDVSWLSQQSRASAGTTDSGESALTPPRSVARNYLPEHMTPVSSPQRLSTCPTVVKGNMVAAMDSIASFDGYGVSAGTRRDLLSELDTFSRVGSENTITPNKVEENQTSESTQKESPTAHNKKKPLNITISNNTQQSSDVTRASVVDSLTCSGTDSEVADLIGGLHSERLTESRVHQQGAQQVQERVAEYLAATCDIGPRGIPLVDHQISQISMVDSVFTDNPPTTCDIAPLREVSFETDDNVMTFDANQNLFGLSERTLEDRRVVSLDDGFEFGTSVHGYDIPDPFRCQAFGPGLHEAIIGIRNFFQVRAEPRGGGCLTVSLCGPRPHAVTETSLTYTGDHIYDVTYQLTLPGTYVISVKWADYPIPESPFVCRATYASD